MDSLRVDEQRLSAWCTPVWPTYGKFEIGSREGSQTGCAERNRTYLLGRAADLPP
jgi:hypothetical protein